MAADPLPWAREDAGVLLLRIHAQPGGKQADVVGIHGDRLKVRIAAPAVDGRANTALIEFLARLFDVARRDVTIESGEHHRDKTLSIRAPRLRPDRDWAQRFTA